MSESNKMKSARFKFMLAIIILAAGIIGLIALARSKARPSEAEHVETAILVDTIPARSEERRVHILSQGTIQPKRVVTLAAEVAGKITWVHPSLVIGGFAKKNTLLLKIEAVDYRLGVAQAQAQVAESEKSLVEAESRAAIAQREWAQLHPETTHTARASPLTLHKPQLALARASLAAAKAGLVQARVRLSRTQIRAPFNLRIRRESVEIGHYVAVGRELAVVFGTDRAEVLIPIPSHELRWVVLPGKISEPVSSLTISLGSAGARSVRSGKLLRSLGEIDTQGQMSKLVAEIDDPYHLIPQIPQPSADTAENTSTDSDYRPDWEMGAFVEVEIVGRTLGMVIPIPVGALRLGNKVWVANSKNILEVRSVTVSRRTKNEALISHGLRPGDRVVTTPISAAIDGMRLRTNDNAPLERTQGT